MTSIFLILGIILVTILGRNIIVHIYRDVSVSEIVALGYIVGLGVFTLVLFILNILGLKYSFIDSNLILALLTITSYYVSRNKKFIIEQIKVNKPALMSIFIYTIIFIIPIIIYGFYWPVKDWDSLALYDYRAISFIHTGYMTEALRSNYDFGYPLFTSISNTWVYSLGSQSPTIIYSLFYISLLVIFFSVLSRATNYSYAVFWTISLGLVNTLFEQAHMTYSNLPYITYLSLGILYISEGIRKSRDRINIGVLLIGLSTWVRGEPFWIIPLVAIFIFSHLNIFDYYYVLAYTFVVKLIQYPWNLYKIKHFPVTDGASPGYLSDILLLTKNIHIPRALEVSTYIWTNVIYPQLLIYVGGGLSVISIFLIAKKKSLHLRFASFIILSSLLLIYVGTYVFSIRYETWDQIGNSAQRMSIFIIPLLFYMIANIYYQILSQYENK